MRTDFARPRDDHSPDFVVAYALRQLSISKTKCQTGASRLGPGTSPWRLLFCSHQHAIVASFDSSSRLLC